MKKRDFIISFVDYCALVADFREGQAFEGGHGGGDSFEKVFDEEKIWFAA